MKFLRTNAFILIVILASMSQFSLTADIPQMNRASAQNLEDHIENARVLIKKLKTKYGTDKPQDTLNPILKQLAMISVATAVGVGTAYAATDKMHDFGNRMGFVPTMFNNDQNIDYQIIAFICGLGTVGLGIGSITYLSLMKLFQDPYVNTQELKDVIAEFKEIDTHIILAVDLQ